MTFFFPLIIKKQKLYCIFVFFISPLDDMNTTFWTNKCSEKEVEKVKYSKLIMYVFVNENGR